MFHLSNEDKLPEVADLTGAVSSNGQMTNDNTHVGTSCDMASKTSSSCQLSTYIPVEQYTHNGNIKYDHNKMSYNSNQGIYPTYLNEGLCYPLNVGHT